MQRLRDLHDDDDPAVATLAEMVQAAGDLEPRRGAEDRVLQAMAERTQFCPSWWLRAAVVLLLVVAVPAAVAGVNKLLEAQPPVATHAVDLRVPAAAPALDRHAPDARIPPTQPSRLPTEPSLAAPHPPPIAQVDRSPVRHIPSRVAHDEHATNADPPGASTESPGELAPAPQQPASEALSDEPSDLALIRSDEAALVLGAMRALRRDHDTQAAIRQLATYRRRFPSGDLAEEALALSIEAFATLDDREAFALASEYLRRFPQGRFRDQAERARRRFKNSGDAPAHTGSPRRPATPRRLATP